MKFRKRQQEAKRALSEQRYKQDQKNQEKVNNEELIQQ